MYQIITKKKQGFPLSREEIARFVQGFTKGEIPDYQASALLMAICLQGMNEEETAILTEEMMHSGDVLDLSPLGDKTVDKHSTGGVGDKTTLILGPIVAACGASIAKMSGRGLGHTGGTVDKMEAIPGMKVDFSSEEFFSIAKKTGLCVAGQSKSLAPADKKLYALRDVTATVDSIPLIASSIMSKKLASGSNSIVLDVKYGSGAFMKTPEEAENLARAMVSIGTHMGRKVRALITDMSSPLGTHIGNALEVKEAAEILKGKGDKELTELCLTLSAHMLSLSLSVSTEEGRALVEEALFSGKAFETMKKWVAAQGGHITVLEDTSLLPLSPFSHTVFAREEGYLSSVNCEEIGLCAGDLGAGRKTKEDTIDPGAGIVLLKKRGQWIGRGEPIALFYAADQKRFAAAEERYHKALCFSSSKPEENPIVFKVIS